MVRSSRDRTTSSRSTARRRRTVLSYTDSYLPKRSRDRVPMARAAGAGGLWDARLPSAPVARGAIGAVDRLELLERAARADGPAGQRGFGQVGGHLRLLAQAHVESLQERSAPGEHDSAVHDVRGELRRGAVQRLLDRVDDLVERFLERLADLLARQHDGLRQPRDPVTPADLRL